MKTSRHGKPGKPPTRLEVSEPAELMEFLIGKMPSQARNNIKSLLTHRQVQVDGEVISRYNHLLQVGQEVMIHWSLIRDEGSDRGLKILYQDSEIIVIDKPAGLLSIASDQEKEITAYRQVRDYVSEADPEERIFIVHRLDRDTSGVMMFARNESIKHVLQDSWKEIVIDRAYVAVVEGGISDKQGTIKSWLKETKTKLMYSSGREGDGLEAVTHYRVLQTNAKYSLLEIRLETGRKNQIRVHLKDMGHSIIGDKKYGSTTNPIGRLGLHAHILAFKHPVSGRVMRFETEVPKKFTSLFR
ncbi:MAG TPA: RNA pseudouridine synthase [Syntrophomonas sp.]|jgi:23S rRNA pseudouridine1911/1915/1917 synthase|nr:RNA pseudouridine synthase [Syntrophomonas sp.]